MEIRTFGMLLLVLAYGIAMFAAGLLTGVGGL